MSARAHICARAHTPHLTMFFFFICLPSFHFLPQSGNGIKGRRKNCKKRHRHTTKCQSLASLRDVATCRIRKIYFIFLSKIIILILRSCNCRSLRFHLHEALNRKEEEKTTTNFVCCRRFSPFARFVSRSLHVYREKRTWQAQNRTKSYEKTLDQIMQLKRNQHRHQRKRNKKAEEENWKKKYYQRNGYRIFAHILNNFTWNF